MQNCDAIKQPRGQGIVQKINWDLWYELIDMFWKFSRCMHHSPIIAHLHFVFFVLILFILFVRLKHNFISLLNVTLNSKELELCLKQGIELFFSLLSSHSRSTYSTFAKKSILFDRGDDVTCMQTTAHCAGSNIKNYFRP